MSSRWLPVDHILIDILSLLPQAVAMLSAILLAMLLAILMIWIVYMVLLIMISSKTFLNSRNLTIIGCKLCVEIQGNEA